MGISRSASTVSFIFFCKDVVSNAELSPRFVSLYSRDCLQFKQDRLLACLPFPLFSFPSRLRRLYFPALFMTDWSTLLLNDRLTYWLSEWQTDGLTDPPTEWLTNCLTNWLADWVTNWLTYRQTDWLTGWQTDYLTDWLADWLNDSLNNWQTEWMTQRLIGWLSDWMNDGQTDWLTEWLADWLWLNDWQTGWLTGRQTDWQTGRADTNLTLSH